MKNLLLKTLCFALIMGLFACEDDENNNVFDCAEFTASLNINEIQMIGSHNSYRQATTPEIMGMMLQSPELLPPGFDPGSWDYNHVPLMEQLNQYNIRSIELDVYRDPQGGLFYNRLGNAMVGLDVSSGIDALNEPGLKILHFPDFDYNTEFYTFKDALTAINNWSDNNPSHLPLYVIVEAKEDSPDLMLPGMGLTSSLNFRNGSVEEIENELLEVYGSNTTELIKPDDIRKAGLSLRESVMQNSWPEIAEARGKIVFLLMADQAVIDDYVAGHASLDNRMMFVFTEADADEAAFINMSNPSTDYSNIKSYVSDGFIVRTQADSDTYEARTGDYTRFTNALNSGAQIICTDYYRPDPRYQTDTGWTDYFVAFEGNHLAIFNDVDMTGCSITEN